MIENPILVLTIFLSSIAFAISLILGIYVLLENPKSAINRLFFLITLLLLPWCIGEIFINTAPDREAAFFWFRILSLGWGFVDLIFLNLVLLVSDMNIFNRRWWLYLPYYLTGFFSFYGTVIVPEKITHLKLTPVGWTYVSNPPLWFQISNDGKMITVILLIIIVLTIWYRKSSHPLQRKQAKIILGTVLISLIFYIISVYVLPNFKTYYVPNISHLVLVFWVVGMGFAILRYRFIVLTPEEIAPQILKTMADPLIVVDKNLKISMVNDSASNILGYSKNYLIGLKLQELFPEEQFFKGDLFQKLPLKGHVENVEILYRGRDGAIIPFLLSASLICDRFKLPAGIVIVLKDISERKRAEVNLKFMATHDLLTGLPNRTILNDRLRQAIARAKRYKNLVAVMLIDLDNFKYVNDTLGHSSGDALLKQTAWRLKTSIRESDTVVRLGGDEFVIVLTDISGVDSLKIVAERIMGTFKTPFIIQGKELYVTPSIGISIYPSDGESVEELLRNADMSLYRAKEAGRNNYQIFSSGAKSTIEKRLQVEKEIRSAIENNEFELNYQPIVDLDSRKVSALEAILKWKHPEKGIISFETFLPVAEQTGLIIPIGKWMLENACKDAKKLEEYGYSVPVAIPISTRQFLQLDFLETVKKVLDVTGLKPENLKIEIHESIATNDLDKIAEIINILHKLGIQFVIYEFGSTYASLLWLRLIPIQAIKLSPLLLKNIHFDPYDKAMVKSILIMAHYLGIKVIADGIENMEQLNFLKSLYGEKIFSLKCDGVQGPLLGEPLKFDDIPGFLSKS